jgi:hypothetical protein
VVGDEGSQSQIGAPGVCETPETLLSQSGSDNLPTSLREIVSRDPPAIRRDNRGRRPTMPRRILPKRKQRRSNITHPGLKELITRVERVERRLREEGFDDGPEGLVLLPDFDVIKKVAQTEYASYGDKGARQHQRLMKLFVEGIEQKLNFPADASPSSFLNDTLDATENLSLRCGFFIGLSRGMQWALTFANQTRTVAAARAAFSAGPATRRVKGGAR